MKNTTTGAEVSEEAWGEERRKWRRSIREMIIRKKIKCERKLKHNSICPNRDDKIVPVINVLLFFLVAIQTSCIWMVFCFCFTKDISFSAAIFVSQNKRSQSESVKLM